MKDILDKLALLESEKPKAALLNKKFSSFRDMEQLQGDAKITTAHKPVQMGDKQKGLTGKLVGTSEAVETTVEDLVAQLGSEFKSQFIGDKKHPKKDRDLANAPADKEIGKKKPANDIHIKESIEDSPVASAITRRIMLQRIDLLSKYGPEKVMAAIDEVADFVGDVEEIGSSDVSGWIKHVEQMLGNMGDEVDEGLGDNERRAFKRQELQHELGHEKNNIQVTINGKPWKVFAGRGTADSTEEYRHLQSMKAWAQKKSAATGKKWDVYLTGSPADVNEGAELKKAKRLMNQAAKDANADQVGAGKKIDTMKNSLRQKDVNKQDVTEGFNFNDKKGRWEWDDGTSYDASKLTPAQKERVAKWKAANPGKRQGQATPDTRGEHTPHGSGAGPRVTENVEMSTSGPMGSMPTDDIPQVQHVTEDWGSSDWTPVMKGMWDVIDRHYAGRANPESIEDAAENAAEFYYDDMGYDSVEDAKDRIIGMFLRRPDGIGRKQDKTPAQELEEAGVIPAAAAAPGAAVAPGTAPTPADAGMQGQLNIKQLASVLPGLDAKTLAMAMTTMKAGQEPSMVQQKALAGAFAALVKADPQTTTKAMAILKKVSAEPAVAPVAAKVSPVTAKPAPVATKPVGTTPVPAATPAPGNVPAEESMDYIKENKRKK